MNTFYNIMHSVQTGLNNTIDVGASVSESMSREVSEGLRPRVEIDKTVVNLPNFVKFVASLDMDPIAWKRVAPRLEEIRGKGVHCTVDTAASMSADCAQVRCAFGLCST